MAPVPWDNTPILPHCTITIFHISGRIADSVFPALYFHGGVVPDDGYDNLIGEDTEIWTSRKEDANPSVNPYTI